MNRYSLRPVLGADYETLLAIESAPDILHSWRLRGGEPVDMQAYENSLWAGIADQRIVALQDGRIGGLAQLYNVDARLGCGWISIILREDLRGKGAPFAAAAGLFVERCFQTWGLRRVYFSVLDPNIEQFQSMFTRPGCHRYGTLRNRTWMKGELVDVHICGVDAEPWLEWTKERRSRLHR
jgi:RimJ/RimL family protein N-acetyltransferase